MGSGVSSTSLRNPTFSISMRSCVARKEFRSSYRLLSLRFDVLEFSEFFELDAHLEACLLPARPSPRCLTVIHLKPVGLGPFFEMHLAFTTPSNRSFRPPKIICNHFWR